MRIENLELLTKRQTAAVFKVKEKTLEGWRVKGLGPKFIRVGGTKKGRVFYRPEDVEEYLSRCSHTSTSDETQQL